MKTVPQLIDYTIKKFANRTAIVDRDVPITYSDLASRSAKLANGLSGIGIEKGDRVGLWLPNITAYIEAFLACASIGAIVVSVNTKFKSFEMADIVSRSGCKCLILWPDFKNIPFLDILSEVPPGGLAELRNVVLYSEQAGKTDIPDCLQDKQIYQFSDLPAGQQRNVDAISPEDGIVIFTTSGTTGKPKFVLHSHGSTVQHAFEVAQYFGYANRDCRMLQAIPLCGTFGLTQAIAGLAAGATIYSLPVFNPEEATRLIREHRVTDMNGSDDMFSMILETSKEEIPFPSLKRGGFAAFNPALKNIVEQAENRGVRLFGLWGMSEVQALVAYQDPMAPAELRKRAGGTLLSPTAKIRITDPETGKTLPRGENGEIEIRTISQMSEYFLNEDATKKSITKDGYVKTGDLGYQEGDRGFVFLSRMGDVLRLGGYLTDPVEIEACLQELEEVHQAQVVGVETAKGVRAFAFVTGPDETAFDEASMIGHCKNSLAGYKVPVAIMCLDGFPMTESANGLKIQRSRLRQDAEKHWKEMN